MTAPDFTLEEKRILVTGASSGIGRAVAAAVARAGATVILNGRNRDRLTEALAEVGGVEGGHLAIPADLTNPGEVDALCAKAGELDGFVHAAGVAKVAPLRYTTDKIVRRLLEVNTEAPIHLARGLVTSRLLRRGASLVFLSSLAALHGWKGYVAYGASKGALVAATLAMASELAAKQIRCNCLCPGIVRTPMLEGGFDAARLAEEEKKYPLGFGDPGDVAAAAIFLLSDAGRWITGQSLVLDGGASLY